MNEGTVKIFIDSKESGFINELSELIIREVKTCYLQDF